MTLIIFSRRDVLRIPTTAQMVRVCTSATRHSTNAIKTTQSMKQSNVPIHPPHYSPILFIFTVCTSMPTCVSLHYQIQQQLMLGISKRCVCGLSGNSILQATIDTSILKRSIQMYTSNCVRKYLHYFGMGIASMAQCLYIRAAATCHVNSTQVTPIQHLL